MTDLLLTSVILMLLALMAWRESLACRERTQLVDRLMARSLPEYKDNQTPEANHIDAEPTTLVEFDDAKEEIIDGRHEE